MVEASSQAPLVSLGHQAVSPVFPDLQGIPSHLCPKLLQQWVCLLLEVMEEALQVKVYFVCGPQLDLVKAEMVCFPWRGFSSPGGVQEKGSGVG